MPFEKGKKRTGGRAQGTPNKSTMAVKQAFQSAFDEIGGAKTLATWASKNQTDFYKLYARLIPQDPTQLLVSMETTNNLSRPLEGEKKQAAIEELCRFARKFSKLNEQKTKKSSDA